MKKLSSIKITFISMILLCSSVNAQTLTLDGMRPDEANLAVAKSETGDSAIDATGGSFSLDVDGSKAKLFFSDFDNVTHEVLLGVYLKKTNRNGNTVKKFYTAAQAREKGICSKSKARGLYYLKKNVTGELSMSFSTVLNEEQNISHFELTEISTVSNLKKALKKYASKKRSDLSQLDSDCNRADGIGW